MIRGSMEKQDTDLDTDADTDTDMDMDLNQTRMRVHQAIQPGSSTCLVVIVNFYLTREVSSASAGPPESPKTYMYCTHKRLTLATSEGQRSIAMS